MRLDCRAEISEMSYGDFSGLHADWSKRLTVS